MATTSFSVTRNDIISAALRAIGVLGRTQTATAQDITYGSQALNILVKQWMAEGATLWKTREITVPLISGISEYPIGPTGAYIASIPVTSGGSGFDGTSTISIAAPASFSGYTGTTATASLTLSGGAITAVNIISGGGGYASAPVITLGGAGSGATFGTPVIAGLVVERPLRILDQGNFIRDSNDLDTPIRLLARNEYALYGSKASSGIVNSFWYNPELTNGTLFVYPTPDDSTRELHLIAQIPYNDFDSASTTPDFPQEWYSTLKYGLARELLIEYGGDEATERRVERRYQESLMAGMYSSQDEAATYFTYEAR